MLGEQWVRSRSQQGRSSHGGKRPEPATWRDKISWQWLTGGNQGGGVPYDWSWGNTMSFTKTRKCRSWSMREDGEGCLKVTEDKNCWQNCLSPLLGKYPLPCQNQVKYLEWDYFPQDEIFGTSATPNHVPNILPFRKDLPNWDAPTGFLDYSILIKRAKCHRKSDWKLFFRIEHPKTNVLTFLLLVGIHVIRE